METSLASAVNILDITRNEDVASVMNLFLFLLLSPSICSEVYFELIVFVQMKKNNSIKKTKRVVERRISSFFFELKKERRRKRFPPSL